MTRMRTERFCQGPASRLAGFLVLALSSSLLAPPPLLAGDELAEEEEIDLDALSDENGEDGPIAKEEEEGGAPSDSLGGGSGVRVSLICTNCNAASLSVNGLSGAHVNTTWDGLPTAGGLATVYALSQFPGDFIGYTGVVRGPGTVHTGAAGIGGSIDFHSAKRKGQRALVQTEFGSKGWSQLRAVGMDRWKRVGAMVFVQGAQSHAWDSNSDNFNDVAEFERFSYHGILDLDLVEGQVLTLEASFYGEDQVDGPGAPETWSEKYLHEDAFFNWRTFRATWTKDLPSGVHVEANARYSRRGQQQWSLSSSLSPEHTKNWTYIIDDERLIATVGLEAPIGASGLLTAGLGWDKLTLNVQQHFVTDDWDIIEDGLEHLEAHVEYNRSVNEKLNWSLGMRLDQFDVFGKGSTLEGESEVADVDAHTFLLPRAKLSYRPRQDVDLNLSIGRGAQGAKPAFEATCCGAKYQRSIDLPSERSWNAQGQIDWKPTPDMRFTTTLFRSDFKDYHERAVYKSQTGIPYYRTAAVPKARVQGLGLVHDMRFKGDLINVGWTATYTDSEVRSPATLHDIEDGLHWVEDDSAVCGSSFFDDPLNFPRTLDTKGTQLRYKPKHTASAYFRYNDTKKGTQFSADASYTGTMSHFELGNDGNGAAFHDPCTPWTFLKSEAFWNVNLRFEQRLGNKGWSAYVGVNNVFDYLMPDLGEYSSAYDWGPIQGRFAFAGAKWLH